MDLDTLFSTLYESSLATNIRESPVLFPWIESIHVLAIVTVVGTILVVDLRLLGLPSHKRGVRALSSQLLPFTWIAFIIAAITGSLLFISNAVKYAADLPFRFKMILLVLAGINMMCFHFGAYKTVSTWDDMTIPPPAARLAGAISLTLWISIIFMGRWIGFTIGE